jgi:NitT/TauT family transport system substrate-binding protein
MLMENAMKTALTLTLGITLTATALAKEPIKIGYSDWPGWVAWEIAKEKGFFKKHTVEVNLVWYPIYTDSLTALTAGKVDANCMAWSDVIPPLADGAKLKVVLVNDNSAGNDAIVAKPGINSIKELKGKSIATEMGTVEHFIMLTALAKNGMGESSVEYKNMTVPDAAAAFLAGKVDAAALWQPWIVQIEREGKGKVLFSSKEIPGLVPDLLAFQESVVNERADEIQKIVATWFDVVDFLKQNEDEAVKIMAKVVGQKPEDYKAFLPGTLLFDLEANLEAFKMANNDKSLSGSGKKITAFLQSKNLIKSVPNGDSALEPKFVNALKK